MYDGQGEVAGRTPLTRDAGMERLEARVRETDLKTRLEECRARIGKMCSERRGPSMSIPVQWYDDDFFISTTVDDARKRVEELEAEIAQYRVWFGCSACGEDHPTHIMCPPHEIRTTGMAWFHEVARKMRDEIARLSSPDLRVVYGYEAGQKWAEAEVKRLREALDTKTDAKMECQHRERMAILQECLSELKALEGKEPKP